eukprot:gnl/MRDRNA2_/MRDRNA2_85645_c0_seq1.p1 gnl/MRDRNA2_/MRDRNA2_85645_c0~~gnl/MRDRNA2_/MRDRNA2_85645_c0_seq1.p1  ORF type:complete len:259 (+),score=33.16 gnl/MRDRNA2_/MRDRNA2_85645_c0_seq1:75-779(+)
MTRDETKKHVITTSTLLMVLGARMVQANTYDLSESDPRNLLSARQLSTYVEIQYFETDGTARTCEGDMKGQGGIYGLTENNFCQLDGSGICRNDVKHNLNNQRSNFEGSLVWRSSDNGLTIDLHAEDNCQNLIYSLTANDAEARKFFQSKCAQFTKSTTGGKTEQWHMMMVETYQECSSIGKTWPPSSEITKTTTATTQMEAVADRCNSSAMSALILILTFKFLNPTEIMDVYP